MDRSRVGEGHEVGESDEQVGKGAEPLLGNVPTVSEAVQVYEVVPGQDL